MKQSSLPVYFYAIIFCLSFSKIQAQNLVMNPSFEQTTATSCGGLFGQESISQVVDWDEAITPGSNSDSCSSSDFFSGCNISGTTSVPNSLMGNQYAHTGTKYMGLIAYDPTSSNYREYIQGQLLSPMVAGQDYCVSLYVNLGDLAAVASNNIGIYFSNTAYYRNPCVVGAIIPFTPQLNYSDAVITDKTNWVRLQWCYTAFGGEQHFIIGNFLDDANTSHSSVSGGGSGIPLPFAYYFIDDVSVEHGTCCHVDIDSVAPVCITNAAFNLTAHAPLSSVCPTPTLNGTWSGTGITNATNGTFNPTTAGAGTHLITFTLPCGVADTMSITVNSCTALSVCKETNGNLTVSGGSAPFTWSQWSSGTTTTVTTQAQCTQCAGTWIPFVNQCSVPSCSAPAGYVQYATGTTVAAPTSFPAQVTDNAGGSFTINDIASLSSCSGSTCPTIDLHSSKQDVTCNGLSNGSITLAPTGGSAPYTYNWSPNTSTAASVSNLAAGTYSVTVFDTNHCSATSSFTISQPAAITVTMQNKQDVACNATNGFIKVTSTGAIPVSYSWNPNVGTTDSVYNLSAGSYGVTATDANGCSASTSIAINQINGVNLSVQSTDASCGNNNGRIKLNATGTNTPFTYTWNPNVSTTDSATNLASGTYRATVTDVNNCSVSATITINATAAVSITSANVRQSCGANSGSIRVFASGGSGTYTYIWNPNVGTTDSISGLSSGSYAVTVSDASGCSTTGNYTITTNTPPTVSISGNTAVCAGATTNLVCQAQPSFVGSYLWSSGATVTSITASAGNYCVTATDTNGCSASACTTVTQNPSPTVNINAPSSYCSGDTATLTASGGTSYVWNTTDTTVNIRITTSGSYSVTATGANSCSATSSITITPVSALGTLNLPDTVSDCEGLSIPIDATTANATSYLWNTSEDTSIIFVDVENRYIVTVSNGCETKTDSTFAVFENCGCRFFLPSAFSPNGDGHNDIYTWAAKCPNVESFVLRIYNRWGEKVFETDNPAVGWDGKFKNEAQPTEVYVAYIIVSYNTGTRIKKISKSGSITLIR